MFVRYFMELDDPLENVEAALLADPSSWMPGMARAAEDLGDRLLVEVGFTLHEDRRLDKEVEINLGEPLRSPTRTRLPMSWKATGPHPLFPSLDADLEVAAVGASRTQLSISARYRPPMGSLGRILDRAALHLVAEAAIRDFLDRVGAAIAGRIRARADE